MSKVTNLKFKEKDGDDNYVCMTEITIRVAENGYVVTMLDDDDEEIVYVVPYKDKQEVIDLVKGNLGI